MGNLSHVLRRSDTSIAVSRLPHYVTGGVESCGSLLRRNYFRKVHVHLESEIGSGGKKISEMMPVVNFMIMLSNVYLRHCSVVIGIGKKSGKVEKRGMRFCAAYALAAVLISPGLSKKKRD